MRILLVEDDESIVEVVTAILNEQNYVVDVATDGKAGWDLVEAFPYDLILLDIVLPKLDGIAFCRRLRSHKKQALVMLLTARDSTTDKLLGLDAGADDYVVKPFDIQELAARIRALLRRGNTVTTSILTCGKLHLDLGACEVRYSDQLLRFSRKEFLLLELFLRHQHRVFSRAAIVDQIWSFSEDPPNEDTVKSHIKSIRRKLDKVGAGDLIETLYGQGYRINPIYLSEAQLPEKTVPTEPQTLDQAVSAIWQRTKGTSLKRVNALKQAVQSLKAERLDYQAHQEAIQNAHKLAGSLGTFGFEAGSQLAHQLENVLQSELDPLVPSAQRLAAPQVERIVQALQTMLDQDGLEQEIPASISANSSSPVQPSVPSSVPLPLVLVVDPEQTLTTAITAQAPEHHLRIAVATTLKMAQKQCQQARPDVVMIDFSLLRTKQAKSHWTAFLADLLQPPAVPIVLLSEQASSKDRVEAIQVGAHLFLPKTMAVGAILQAVAALVTPPEIPPLKILLVDDDPLILSVLKTCLEPQGIQLLGLEDPAQFWETLQTIQPDLLILDVNMPEINGIELCQTVRADLQWGWLPIIFLTAQTDQQTQLQVFFAGADDLITKPIEAVELSNRIVNRLRRTQFHQDLKTKAELKHPSNRLFAQNDCSTG